ncbi:uncharacterized protein LOC142576168 isoform X2 [Dermacentor variabilis]|uniref:uncharacterized protein LOC142576168 isoform X2 n=1 Tax=Dermacentor variabilis TaxID=34621 RepID=UPI003F5C2629
MRLPLRDGASRSSRALRIIFDCFLNCVVDFSHKCGVHRAGVETAQGGPGSWVPTGAPGGEGVEEAPLGAVQEGGGGGAATASQAEGVAAAATAAGSSSSSAASCSGVNGMVAGTSSQQVALADLPTADQLKAMGLCDTLIILSDTGQGAQPVSLVSSLEVSLRRQQSEVSPCVMRCASPAYIPIQRTMSGIDSLLASFGSMGTRPGQHTAEGAQQSTCESFFGANKEHYCHCRCHDYSAMRAQNSQPIQCLEGTAEAVARSGANLVLCLPDESLSLEVGTSVQEVPGWTWVQDPTSAAAVATGEAAALVRHSAPIVVSGTPTLATAPGGEMLLVMDSSPVEDSVGLAAKSWFNDSVIATQALLTLEGHK